MATPMPPAIGGASAAVRSSQRPMAGAPRPGDDGDGVLAHFLLLTSGGSLVLVLAVSTAVAVGFWLVVSAAVSLVGRAVWRLSARRRLHPR
jgi:hypothetical protein